MLPVEVIDSSADRSVCRVFYGQQELQIPFCQRPPGCRLFIGLRADDIIIGRQQPQGLSLRNALEGRITDVTVVGGKRLVYVDVGHRIATKITPEAAAELGLAVGQQVFCLFKTHSIRVGPELD